MALLQKGSLLAKIEGFSYNWRKKTKDFSVFEIVVDKGFILDQKSSFINLGKQLLGIGKAVPLHVTIIPDGNRRWARARGLPGYAGDCPKTLGRSPDRLRRRFHRTAVAGVASGGGHCHPVH